LADLGGRSLLIQDHSRACLAPFWLDTLLLRQGLKPAAQLADRIKRPGKLAQVVLPVFFRQVDACVVARSGFNAMVDLNPQVGRQLKIIAASPAVVPTVLCFRADFNASYKKALLEGLRTLNATPAGQQVLTIFHIARIDQQPVAALDSALELLTNYGRLCGDTNAETTVSGQSGRLSGKATGGGE
jgi:ABC-type phosphate/phosphonate transport system substrate-binding protein